MRNQAKQPFIKHLKVVSSYRWHLRQKSLPPVHTQKMIDHKEEFERTIKLAEDKYVYWLEQMIIKEADKRRKNEKHRN